MISCIFHDELMFYFAHSLTHRHRRLFQHLEQITIRQSILLIDSIFEFLIEIRLKWFIHL